MSNTNETVRVLQSASKLFGTDVPITTLQMLLSVPMTGTIPFRKLREQNKLTEAGASRVMATLNNHNLAHRRVMGRLVDIFVDRNDRRYRNVGLTKYGRQVIEHLYK